MNFKRFLALGLALSLSLTMMSMLAGCSSNQEDVVLPDTTPEISDTTPDTAPDATPEILPETGEDLPVAEIPEESDDEEVATGDIALSRTDFTLFHQGDSYQLTLSNLIASDVVTFSTTNEEIATVSEDGTVTAVGAGTTTVIATILLDGITAVERSAIVRCDIEIPQTSEPEAPVLTVAEFFAQIQTDFVSAGSLMLLEGEMLTGSYPGLSGIDTLQCAIYAPMMSFSAMELALVEVANSADIDAVKAVFQARIDAQVAGGAWYPAAIEGWQNNSHIVTSGNYVFLVVTSGYQADGDAAITETAQDFIDAFEAAF